jgi:hypothetical protein
MKDTVAEHSQEPGIDLALFAAANAIHSPPRSAGPQTDGGDHGSARERSTTENPDHAIA